MPRSAHTMVERSDNCKGGAFVKLNNMPRHVQPYGARTFQGKKGKLKKESHFLGTNVKCQQKTKQSPTAPQLRMEKNTSALNDPGSRRVRFSLQFLRSRFLFKERRPTKQKMSAANERKFSPFRLARLAANARWRDVEGDG